MICDAMLPMAAVTPAPAPDDDYWYGPVAGDSDVTPDTAMQVSAVFACIVVRAETIAQLPLHLMRERGGRKRQARTHPLYEVLHSRPNHWQTSFDFRATMQAHLDRAGNAFAQIRPGPRGPVDELIPLHPDRMTVFLLENKRLGYLYRDKQGTPYRLTQDEVFHLRGLSMEGYLGLSPIAAARNAIELAMQQEQHGLKFMKNAAKPGGVIEFPEGQTLDDPEDHRRLRQSWREAHTGDDLFTVAILEGGAKWQQMGISNEDAQWLQSRRYQIVEIARMFRIPPHMIQSAIEHGHTYANVEQSDLAFLKHTMLPWISRWEQAISRDLIVDPAYYPRFEVEGLLRADSAARAAFFEKMIRMGVYSRNDVRQLEDLDPVDGGDVLLIPSGLVPADQLGEEPQVVPVPAPAEPGDDGARLLEDSHPNLILNGWIQDAAERLASAEIRELSKRAEKAGEDPCRFAGWARDHWLGKQAEYTELALAPILSRYRSRVSSSALAHEICEAAMDELITGDPVEVLKRWKRERKEQIANLLLEGIQT